MRRVAAGAAVVLVVLFFFLDLEPGFAPRPDGIEVSAQARRLHDEALVIDLHIDSLLWPRDLEIEGRGGQVDFPRMRRGGLDAAAFTIPTRFFGVAGLKALHDLWPPRSWWSPWERLRQQMAKAEQWTTPVLATDSASIRRNHDEGRLSYFFGIEGAHALERDVSRVSELRRAGVLFIGLVHLSDNEVGGSSSGSDRGLTAFGRELIARMNREGVLVDLAHASPRTFAEAIEATELPPLVSHAGARGVHDTWRNLSDEQIRAVARRGGVVGAMLAPPALEEPSLEEAMEHLERIVEVGGEDCAALGSDFDGYVEPAIDVTGLPQLTELMLRRGWSEERIRKVLGGNVLRVLGTARDSF
jgi:microsomal dipeptidase-like Zn-dependent dipeptidase